MYPALPPLDQLSMKKVGLLVNKFLTSCELEARWLVFTEDPRRDLALVSSSRWALLTLQTSFGVRVPSGRIWGGVNNHDAVSDVD